jgi:YjbE family integral membrane protein
MGPFAQYLQTAPYLHTETWRDWLHASIDHLGYAAFWVAALQIVFINLLLSGDNAVIIAMACRGLPALQRRWGIVLGAGVAVVLRIVFVGIIAELMLLPYFKLAGGAALVLIAAKLIVPEPERDDVRAAAHLWRAVMIVAAADIIMSVDNVIAIAAAARGDILLLVIGIAVSVPMIMAGAAMIIALIDRFPILVWAGAALLGWVAGDTIATDPVVIRFAAAFGDDFPQRAELAAGAAATLLAIGIGGLWRGLHVSNAQALTRNAKASRG